MEVGGVAVTHAADTVLIALAECVRDLDTPEGMVRVVFHYTSHIAEALARIPDPLTADIAATLQLGPPQGGSDVWHCGMVEGQALSAVLATPTAAWVLLSEPDELRFVLITAKNDVHAFGVNRFGPPSVFTLVVP